MTEFRPSRFEILPLIIKNLLIVNVLFFLAQKTVGLQGFFNMEDFLALHHVKSPLFKPWQLVTHMFLHGNLMHLIGNMFALWMFGSVLENLWGPKRFLTFYFICGIGAALLHLAFLWYSYNPLLQDFMQLKQRPSPELIAIFYQNYGLFQDATATNLVNNYLREPSNTLYLDQALSYISDVTYRAISTATLGASGGVFGVLAAFVYLFPNTYIYLYFFVPVKAKWIGAIYFGIEIYYAWQNSAGDNVARWAHIGGAIVGFILVLTWNRKNRKRFY
ncbi:MAG TPA: rhomboid family intramembrane serine protease [Segetibacter sp.]|jgi:membrane associated rhomboid family serine protease